MSLNSIRNYLTVFKAITWECTNWPSIVLAKITNRRLEDIQLRSGARLAVGDIIGKADLSMFAEIWHEHFYTPKGFEIHEHDIVFDIGANNGFFSAYAATKASQGKVYAFEPVPSLHDKIKQTAKLNNFTQLIVEQQAIGSAPSESTFYVSKNHNGRHSLYKREDELEEIKVSVIDLKSYCTQHQIKKIDFLKLDCEGAEYQIINDDSIDFIRQTVNKISMEYHDTINIHTHHEIVKTLETGGFSINISGDYLYAKNRNK